MNANKQLIIEILDKLGLGKYGVMPSSLSIFCGRLGEYLQHFTITSRRIGEKQIEVKLTCESGEIILNYTINGKRIEKIEVLSTTR